MTWTGCRKAFAVNDLVRRNGLAFGPNELGKDRPRTYLTP